MPRGGGGGAGRAVESERLRLWNPTPSSWSLDGHPCFWRTSFFGRGALHRAYKRELVVVANGKSSVGLQYMWDLQYGGSPRWAGCKAGHGKADQTARVDAPAKIAGA